MHLQIIKQLFIALFLAILFMMAFNWQFTYIYTFLIENSKEVKLSTLYTHLFIYGILIFTMFLFLMNLINAFLKSRFFIAMIVITFFLYYFSAYEVFLDTIKYFLHYVKSSEELMFIVLFIILTLVYQLYSLGITLFNKRVPFFHSLVFLILALAYSAWFIDTHAYPIETLDKEMKLLLNKAGVTGL